ncbi:DMT family transporter [Parasalinivibrio latis]|uniref:DMT family transporter n=1 Tax=Parasalinivibrio latis TaxID=2952610 RepID=UPI003DA351A5
MHQHSKTINFPKGSQYLIGISAGVGAAIIWGLWPVITRLGVTTQFSAEEIVAVRFVFAGLLLLPYYFGNKVYKRIKPARAFVLASGAGAIYVYVSALGLKFAPAGHLGIVETGTMLSLSALGGYLLLRESKSVSQIAGYIFVLTGMLVVNWQSFNASTADVLLGDGLLVLGGVLWALYTVMSKMWNLNAWDAVSTVSVWSLFIWVPLILVFSDINLTESDSTTWVLQGIGQGVVTGILGLWLYTVAIDRLGAARGSLFGALVPAIAVLGGFLFLQETPTVLELAGVTLTTIGILASLKE